jgi:hypothetical protein
MAVIEHEVGEPNRVSALNSLTKCVALVAMRATEEDSVSGKAADTGTGVGRGAELWHRGYTWDKVLRTLKDEHEADFPKADMAEVEKLVKRYCDDPRNLPHYVVERSLEQEVLVEIPGEPPWIAVGHTDQVRYCFPDHPDREELGFRLWDIKNGKADGETMLGDYAFQLSAYAKGLAATGTYPGLMVGGVIRTKGYITRSKLEPGEHNVFFHAGWDLDDCDKILANVMIQLQSIRDGVIAHTPGAHCRYCPLNWPNCLAEGTLTHHLEKPKKKRLPCT